MSKKTDIFKEIAEKTGVFLAACAKVGKSKKQIHH